MSEKPYIPYSRLEIAQHIEKLDGRTYGLDCYSPTPPDQNFVDIAIRLKVTIEYFADSQQMWITAFTPRKICDIAQDYLRMPTGWVFNTA